MMLMELPTSLLHLILGFVVPKTLVSSTSGLSKEQTELCLVTKKWKIHTFVQSLMYSHERDSVNVQQVINQFQNLQKLMLNFNSTKKRKPEEKLEHLDLIVPKKVHTFCLRNCRKHQLDLTCHNNNLLHLEMNNLSWKPNDYLFGNLRHLTLEKCVELHWLSLLFMPLLEYLECSYCLELHTISDIPPSIRTLVLMHCPLLAALEPVPQKLVCLWSTSALSHLFADIEEVSEYFLALLDQEVENVPKKIQLLTLVGFDEKISANKLPFLPSRPLRSLKFQNVLTNDDGSVFKIYAQLCPSSLEGLHISMKSCIDFFDFSTFKHCSQLRVIILENILAFSGSINVSLIFPCLRRIRLVFRTSDGTYITFVWRKGFSPLRYNKLPKNCSQLDKILYDSIKNQIKIFI